MNDDKNIFPDLTRMRLETRLFNAGTVVEQQLAAALITLYDQGAIEVQDDPFTGELMYRSAELN
jgi:hypothetical protein